MAGASVAAITTCALPAFLAGPSDPSSTISIAAGLVGLPSLLYTFNGSPNPPFAMPMSLLGGFFTGCIAAPFAWDVAVFAPPAVPLFAASILLPALIGAEAGTQLARRAAKSSSRDAFSNTVFALEAILVAGVVVAFTKYTLDRVFPPTPAETAAMLLPRAAASATMSAAGAAWWAVFIRTGTSPLSVALFTLLVAASPSMEVARAMVHELKRSREEGDAAAAAAGAVVVAAGGATGATSAAT